MVVATYQYTDEQGNILYEKDRIEPGSDGKKKSFSFRRPFGFEWVSGLGDTRRVLYNLPAIIEGETVYLCEGEKDADTLIALGFTATTLGGASEKWTDDRIASLTGKDVIMLPDQDGPGQKFCKETEEALSCHVRSFAVINVPAKDVTEWFQTGGTVEAFMGMVEVAKLPSNSAVRRVGDLIRKRGRPSAIESEKLILGALLRGGTAFEEVGSILIASDFEMEAHGKIFTAIQELSNAGESTDIKAVAQSLKEKGEVESVGGLTYLIDLTDDLPPMYILDSHIAQVQKKSEMRQFMAKAMTAVESLVLTGDIDAARVSMGEAIESSLAVGSHVEDMPSAEETINLCGDSMFDQQESGILSGIEALDDMTYGFRAGQLIVVGARPGDGKSSLATQICTKSAKEGHETHILSLEVTKDVCLKKMICSAAKIGYQDVLRGRITPEDKKKLLHIRDRFKKLPLRIDDASSAWTLQKIRNHVKRYQFFKKPIRLLMIDYLQLMPLSKSKSRERHDLAIGEMTSGLKQICNEFGLTIILLSQLSREGEKQNRVPQKSDLRDSGSIESDADTIIMIWHEKKDDSPEKYARRALLIVEKQREGATGNVEVLFLKPITTFTGRDYFDRQKAA